MNEPEKQPETPASEETSATPEQTEDFAGYNSLEEMRAAIYASRKEGKRLAEQNAAMAAQLAYAVQQRNTRAAERSALEEINDLGIPSELLGQAMREVAMNVAQETEAPRLATNQAIAAISADTPEFAQLSPDFGRWLTANSDVEAAYHEAAQKSPKAAEFALRGAFAMFKDTRKPKPSAEPKKVPNAGKLPATQASGAVRKDPSENKLSKDEYKDLVKDARRTGSPVELMRALIGNKPIHRDIESAKG